MKGRAELRAAYEALTEAAFPPHAHGDQLEDALMLLLELDGHYAGIAASALAGGRPSRPAEEDLLDVEGRLSRLRPTKASGEDAATLDAAHQYVRLLRRVHSALPSA